MQPTDEFAKLKHLTDKVSGAGLEQLGWEFDDRTGMDRTAHVHFRHGGYIIRLSQSFRDGRWCDVACAQNESEAADAGYVSLWSKTVPGFDDFSIEEKMTWSKQVPTDHGYEDYILDHILKLRPVKIPEGSPDRNFPFEGNYGHLERSSEGWIFKYQAGGLYDPLLESAISDEDAKALIAGTLSEEDLVKRLEAAR